jgi:peptide/nickel transport system permease protein
MQRSDYIISKLFFALATLVAVIVFNFFLFRVLPGDPVRMIVHSPRMTREAQDRIRQQFGLDKPVWFDGERLEKGDVLGALDTQFSAYLHNLVRGNLGVSFTSRRDVADVLKERVWRTVLLLALGEALAIVAGMALGLLAAWRRGSKLDSAVVLWGLFTWAIPTFFFGIVLMILARGHLPTGQMVTPGLKPGDGWAYWSDVGKHLVMPIIVMGVGYISSYMMVMRSSVVEVLSEDYILTAKAKGLSTFQIMRDHALKNAMLPMITLITLSLGYTVGGAVQVETVFSWPGIGRLMYESVGKRDYPMLQGIFLLVAISVIAANLLADMLYSVLDPRVQKE